MEDTSEVSAPTPALEQKRNLRRAREELVNRRLDASDQFKTALLVASNAIQTSRMLENLQVVLNRKQKAGENVAGLEHALEKATTFFRGAIQKYDENEIFEAEGRVEQLTLTHDPFYLEGEEVRKTEYYEKKRRAGIPRATWATNPSSRFVSLLKGDLEGIEEVTEEEQRSCISKCAWGFAIIGMIIAISFTIADFWSAQANPALSTTLIQHEDLDLPVIHACVTIPNLPTFQDLPNEDYPGGSLWGLRSYTHEDTKESLLFPKTKSITEPSFLGRPEHCSNTLKYLSKRALVESLNTSLEHLTSKKCFSCLKIGSKSLIRLNREEASRRPSGGVTLEFATSRLLEFCLNPAEAGNTMLRNYMRDLVKAEGEALVQRGILTIIESPTVDFAFDYGFEDFKTAFPDRTAPRLNAEATVLCNLYFFSGYFFPVEPGTETRYSYDINGGLESWKQVGDGANFLKVEQGFNIREKLDISKESILETMRGAGQDTGLLIAETSVRIFKVDKPEDPPGAYKDFAATLRRNRRDVLLFSKNIDNGVDTYSTTMQYGERKIFKAVGTYRRYNISLDYRTFETEVTIRRPTTSTAEFLTDIFEYVGLFTGICAYSVLVGPARMYLKRKPKQQNGST